MAWCVNNFVLVRVTESHIKLREKYCLEMKCLEGNSTSYYKEHIYIIWAAQVINHSPIEYVRCTKSLEKLAAKGLRKTPS